jgi:hypothetical protein
LIATTTSSSKNGPTTIDVKVHSIGGRIVLSIRNRTAWPMSAIVLHEAGEMRPARLPDKSRKRVPRANEPAVAGSFALGLLKNVLQSELQDAGIKC